MGRKKYREEQTHKTSGITFKQWLTDNCGFTFGHCYKLIRLSEKLKTYPKLVYCSVSLSFMLQYADKICDACVGDEAFAEHWIDQEQDNPHVPEPMHT